MRAAFSSCRVFRRLRWAALAAAAAALLAAGTAGALHGSSTANSGRLHQLVRRCIVPDVKGKKLKAAKAAIKSCLLYTS